MAIIHPYQKEKLICGLLYHSDEFFNRALSSLIDHFGETDYRSEAVDFNFSHYYDEEIGGSVKRSFMSFKKLVSPSALADIKIATNKLEQCLAVKGQRPVNIDPGLIALGKLVLATTKNASHRIALKDGIYAEMTLFYSRKKFQTLPWSYPDFSSEAVKEQMKAVRSLYYQQFKDGEC